MIGIFGGTFAPIHNGHLRLAIEAREQLGLAQVHLVPAARPPLRATPPIAGARRLRWVKLAIAGEKGLVADGRELRRPGLSYTVDTLAELRARNRCTPLCLLLGQDAARQLPRWHRWDELLDFAHLVFFDRAGAPQAFGPPLARALRGRRARSVAQLAARPAGFWWRGALPSFAVSSSEVRRRLRERLSVRGLVPDRVIADFTRKDLEAFARA